MNCAFSQKQCVDKNPLQVAINEIGRKPTGSPFCSWGKLAERSPVGDQGAVTPPSAARVLTPQRRTLSISVPVSTAGTAGQPGEAVVFK